LNKPEITPPSNSNHFRDGTPGDIVFGLGALLIAVFVFKLWRGSLRRVLLTKGREGESPLAAE
jgi:hypothetical protein